MGRELRGLIVGSARSQVSVEVPSVLGSDFFGSDPDVQASVNEWYQANVPEGSDEVFVMNHEPGLAQVLTFMDAHFLIALPDQAASAEYAPMAHVTTYFPVSSIDHLTFVVTSFPKIFEVLPGLMDDAPLPDTPPADLPGLMSTLNSIGIDTGGGGHHRSTPEPEDEEEPASRRRAAQRQAGMGNSMAGAPAGMVSPMGPGPARPPRQATGPAAMPTQSSSMVEPTTPHPFDLMGDMVTPRRPAVPPAPPAPVARAQSAPAPAPRPAAQAGSGRALQVGLPRLLPMVSGRKGNGVGAGDQEVARRLRSRKGFTVAIGSRKGGVGKTTTAAAVAVGLGRVVNLSGGWAALYDFNVVNPGDWGELELPPGAATVRQLIAALVSDREAPQPGYVNTPGLVLYPYGLDTTESTSTEIDLVANYNRVHWAAAVIDTANRLPGLGDPAGEVVAFWMEHADCLVLPTTANPEDLLAVLDYLAVDNLPPTIVAYVVSASRRVRTHPAARRYLDEIATKVFALVEIPADTKDELKQLKLDGRPINEAPSKFGRAYQSLIDAISQVPERRRD